MTSLTTTVCQSEGQSDRIRAEEKFAIKKLASCSQSDRAAAGERALIKLTEPHFWHIFDQLGWPGFCPGSAIPHSSQGITLPLPRLLLLLLQSRVWRCPLTTLLCLPFGTRSLSVVGWKWNSLLSAGLSPGTRAWNPNLYIKSYPVCKHHIPFASH